MNYFLIFGHSSDAVDLWDEPFSVSQKRARMCPRARGDVDGNERGRQGNRQSGVESGEFRFLLISQVGGELFADCALLLFDIGLKLRREGLRLGAALEFENLRRVSVENPTERRDLILFERESLTDSVYQRIERSRVLLRADGRRDNGKGKNEDEKLFQSHSALLGIDDREMT
jgi:hypothetical protein